MGASIDRDRRAATAVCRVLAQAHRHHTRSQLLALRTRRPIRARVHAATDDLVMRAFRAESVDPPPREPCTCATCLAYIARR